MGHSTVLSSLTTEFRRNWYRKMPRVILVLSALSTAAVIAIMVAEHATFRGLSGVGDVVRGLAVSTSLASAVLGASLVGAEFTTGDVVITIVWQTNRYRLAFSKIVAVALSCMICAAGVQLIVIVGYLGGSMAAGSGLGEAGGDIASAIGGALVGALLVGGVAASVSLALRSSVAFPVGFVVFHFAGDRLLAAAASSSIVNWLPATNLMVLSTGDDRFASAGFSPSYAALVSTLWLVVAAGVATALFHRWEPR
jgi:hypothetical protein